MPKSETYEDFVKKFEPKRTTDDCYTPPAVYGAVEQYVRIHYNIPDDTEFVRPFYPGIDYQSIPYADNNIVVDNPPFSILSKIIKYYQLHSIRFFLFAPTLTGLGTAIRGNAMFIGAGASIKYENGAQVNTSFITNLEPCGARSDPELYGEIKAVQESKMKRVGIDNGNILTGSDFAYYSKHGSKVQVINGRLATKYTDGRSVFGAGIMKKINIKEKKPCKKQKPKLKPSRRSMNRPRRRRSSLKCVRIWYHGTNTMRS